MKNGTLNHEIKYSPYETVFNIQAKIGLKNILLPSRILYKYNTDKDLKTGLNSISTTVKNT